jgi:hypothetical protein
VTNHQAESDANVALLSCLSVYQERGRTFKAAKTLRGVTRKTVRETLATERGDLGGTGVNSIFGALSGDGPRCASNEAPLARR